MWAVIEAPRVAADLTSQFTRTRITNNEAVRREERTVLRPVMPRLQALEAGGR